jgi:hypothetical protein
MDEATREMITREVDIWTIFGLGLVLIFQWFTSVFNLMNQPEWKVKYPRMSKFSLWASGIAATVWGLTPGLFNTIFDSPNPLHPWMRVVLVLAYLAVWGYIIKRRSTISSSKISK